MLQITSAGEHLTLDMVRTMQNLKKAIMAYKKGRSRQEERGSAPPMLEGGSPPPEGGFLAFWKSVDAAQQIRKVPFRFAILYVHFPEFRGIRTYAAIFCETWCPLS